MHFMHKHFPQEMWENIWFVIKCLVFVYVPAGFCGYHANLVNRNDECVQVTSDLSDESEKKTLCGQIALRGHLELY